LVVAVVALAEANSPPAPQAQMEMFNSFIKKFGKRYGDENEYKMRLNNYVDNLNKAAQLNRNNPRANFGETIFSDLSAAEFAATHLTAQASGLSPRDYTIFQDNYTLPSEPHPIFRNTRTTPNPTTFDWGSVGVVSPVYNQGNCGSCWAFSATETIESYHALKSGKMVELSIQQVVDCDTSDAGCGGGNTETAYNYVKKAGGIESGASYPYVDYGGGSSGGGSSSGYSSSSYSSSSYRRRRESLEDDDSKSERSSNCAFKASDVVTSVSSYTTLKNEAALYPHLSSASGGPISICVDASSWQNYQSGVVSNCNCHGYYSIDHCVQLTGYQNHGTSSMVWKVRNSWGADWGESGYIYLKANMNACCLGDDATYVVTTN